ncbi:response regulator [Pseudaestuariivita atlantica]|uniref:Regulatory protein VirG n=1 Tax=Pseudaestuariivita atlantica TaxID=1317121 RepID=A0A0L1JKB3_9RHOB|nr:response regulator [Pseudaestuariivita atlantica]KNG92186.1 transcriptional regulatory protein AruR [Pseudaestuariivita atlantica]
MTSNTILIVDDEPKVRLLLRRCLESDGFTVVEAEDEPGTLAAVSGRPVQLVTLDVNLGGENGLEIAKRIRQRSDVPIIMVSGRDDVIDRVVGLEVGADDYITKPFHVREVLARVRSVLRRTDQMENAQPSAPRVSGEQTTSVEAVTFDGMIAYLDRFELLDRDGAQVEMTSGDFRLLAIFLGSPKRMLSRDRIMDLLHGTEWTPFDRTIDNQVARLRKKIERDPTSPSLIKTVRGIGYMFAMDVKQTED